MVIGNTHDTRLVTDLLRKKKIDGVIHFAAYIEVEESMREPYLYFNNNLGGSLQLLEAMRLSGVKNIVFSSTAAVYGEPKTIPITESSEKNPTSPYGQSKLMTEQVLDWYQRIYKINYTVLRYFNAAGATLDGQLGESHTPETHLIPNIINSIIDEKGHSRAGRVKRGVGGNPKPFTLFGTDYHTPDGTCVRDYVHVLDLAQYHILALKYLFDGGQSRCFNSGAGKGYSNREVIKMVEEVAGKKVTVKEMDRRAGDPARLIADNRAIMETLRYKPKYSDLKTIVESAWKWHTHKKY